jgi:hypothetical protein
MPKPHTFPTLYDEVKTVCISFLTKHGYLKPNQIKAGTVHWSRNGEEIGSISIEVCTYTENRYLEFDYKCNQQPIKYRVQLVTVPSNLGKGFVWYFVCPRTGKRCRKLYLADTYFFHRTAFKGCMYECQTQSKNARLVNNVLLSYLKADQYYSILYRKHFKKTYAGKPTKKYFWIMERIKKTENLDY